MHVQGSIGEVSTTSVACGVLDVGGNKGAVGVTFTLFRRRVLCICSHFAAHQVQFSVVLPAARHQILSMLQLRIEHLVKFHACALL